MPWIHVELPGHGRFWIESAVLEGRETGPLAPEDHISDGQLDWSRCFDSDSYAHVFSEGRIQRYGVVIGNIRDLVPLDRVAVVNVPPGALLRSPE